MMGSRLVGATSSEVGEGRTRGPRLAGMPIGLLMWGYACISVAPLLLVLIDSFRPTGDIIRSPVGLPTEFYLGNYERALGQGQFFGYLGNSFALTGAAVAISTIIGIPAAYALARWRLPGSGAMILLFLAGLMLPLRFTVLPLFFEFQSLGLSDSQIGLVLFYAASNLPFSIFVLVPFIRELPVELEEAAALDGAGPASTFLRVMLPLLRPSIVVVVIFCFIPLWNEFFFPLILLRSPEKFPVAVGLTTFFGKYSLDLGPLFAALVLSALPLVILFLFAVKRIVAGLSAGMFK